MSGMGMRKPNSARLGTVCMRLANPSTGRRQPARRVSRIPRAMPIDEAMPTAISTMLTCSSVSSHISLNGVVIRSPQTVAEGLRFLAPGLEEIGGGFQNFEASFAEQRDARGDEHGFARIVGDE